MKMTKIIKQKRTWTSLPAHLHSSRREVEGGQDIYHREREILKCWIAVGITIFALA